MPRSHYLAAALLVLAMLWPATGRSSGNLFGTSWKIIEIAGAPATADETIAFEAERVSGKAACNRYGAKFAADAGGIRIAGVFATRMFCQDKMQAEQALFLALERVRKARFEGDKLVLVNDRDGVELRLAPQS